VLTEFDLALRGGLCGLLLLMAGLMLRDHPRATAARLGALFALGAAAYVVCSTPGFHARAGLWAAPALGLAAANNLVFWLFARALFDDGFRPRGWHAGLWLFIAGCGVVDGLGLDAAYPMWREPIRAFLAVEALGFALLAGAQTLSSWRADLVEPRRRLRVFIVAAAGAHIAISAIANLVAGGWWGRPCGPARPQPSRWSPAPWPGPCSALAGGATCSRKPAAAWGGRRRPRNPSTPPTGGWRPPWSTPSPWTGSTGRTA
jgi:hypothetical protein